MIQDDDKVNYLEQLRKNWVIIAFIGALIAGWTNIQSKITQNARDISDLKIEAAAAAVKYDGVQSQVSEINGDIKEIKTSIEFIKQQVSR